FEEQPPSTGRNWQELSTLLWSSSAAAAAAGRFFLRPDRMVIPSGEVEEDSSWLDPLVVAAADLGMAGLLQCDGCYVSNVNTMVLDAVEGCKGMAHVSGEASAFLCTNIDLAGWM
ncbi:hypothetical protein HJC23_010982, partial [Cyclotella cryptica]